MWKTFLDFYFFYCTIMHRYYINSIARQSIYNQCNDRMREQYE